MHTASKIQSEVGWAKVFLAFLKEAEMETDQIRMHGMGISWTPAPSAHHGADLMRYFEMLDHERTSAPAPARMAKAVGSRVIRNS